MQVLRLAAVIAKTGVSRPRIYYLMDRGEFPKPIKLSERAVGWVEAEIDAWIKERMEARDRLAS